MVIRRYFTDQVQPIDDDAWLPRPAVEVPAFPNYQVQLSGPNIPVDRVLLTVNCSEDMHEAILGCENTVEATV